MRSSTDTKPRVDGRRIEVAATEGHKQLLQALRLLHRDGVEPTDVVLREPTLDDVFLNLTGHPATDRTGPSRYHDAYDRDRTQEVDAP